MAGCEKMDCGIWEDVAESYDQSIGRLTAIVVKESDYNRYFTYPDTWNNLGYCFDFSDKTVYDNPPKFRLDFAVYSYPDLRKSSSTNPIIFDSCKYYPSMVVRNFRYANLGIICEERMGQAVDGALSWRIDMRSITEWYHFKKRLYTILASDEQFQVNIQGSEVEIGFEDLKYYISCSPDASFGVLDGERSLKASLCDEILPMNGGKGYYLVIAHDLDLKQWESASIVFGLSSISAERAKEAVEASAAMTETISGKWNKWFESLPRLNFLDKREAKAFYKSWWTIKINYFNHPQWGFSITEALPVYKGLWQWAMPSVEWHADQNTEHTSEWVKKSMNMLVDSQRDDGYITHAIYIDEEKPGERWAKGKGVVQTPHLPWVAIRYYNVTGDIESLKKWFGAFKAYYGYLCNSRDRDFKNLHLWGITTSYDTGLDTTSVFQRVTYDENGVSEEYCYPVIFAAERCRYEQAMGRMAGILGMDGSEWYREAEKTRDAMNLHLWDRNKKWYGVLHQDGTLDTRVGVDGMFPLVYHLVDMDQAALMEENFKRLIGPFGIRTVARGEKGFREDVYWRGASWPKTCSLAMEICRNYYPHLKQSAYQAVTNMVLSHPNVWECYNADTGALARSDHGFMSTPCVSSNVGAGDVIGSLLLYRGFEMYGMDDVLPLEEIKNYHWNGMRISVEKGDNNWKVTAKEAEKSSGILHFKAENGILDVKVDAKDESCVMIAD